MTLDVVWVEARILTLKIFLLVVRQPFQDLLGFASFYMLHHKSVKNSRYSFTFYGPILVFALNGKEVLPKQ